MQLALIADLHGNRPATEALEKDLALTKPDAIWCLGDMVGKGPSSDFTYEWAMAHCQKILGGNWDYGVGHQMFPRDVFYWNQLGEERLKVLRELPEEEELWLSGRRIRLFHGRPIMKELIYALDDRELIEPLFRADDGSRYDAVIYADAHRQSMRTMSPGLFVNVGSVGNNLGEPRCCYAILCGEPGREAAPFEIRLRQVDYDREQAVRDVAATPDLPNGEAFIREVRTGIYSRKPTAPIPGQHRGDD